MRGHAQDHGFSYETNATRPVVQGRRFAASSGHPLASMAGMRIFALGGNAIDAGVAMVFAQAVLEPQSYGFGGEMALLLSLGGDGRVVAINGNMRAPAAATVAWFQEKGIELIPDDGFLPAGVCGVADALILALERYGQLTLEQVLEPAIDLAAGGFPMYEALRNGILRVQSRITHEWPSSAALFLPGGQVPDVGSIWCNPDLARTYQRLIDAERAAVSKGRGAGLHAARDAFYRGGIAREIVTFQRETRVRDANGMEMAGLLEESDFAGFAAVVEHPVQATYRDYDVYKCGPWCQGPVFLQQLGLLEGFALTAFGHNSADYVHVVTEASKLAFADREKFYGDPEFVDVPLQGLLSRAYADARRGLIDLRNASDELRSGDPHAESSVHVEETPMVTREWQAGTTGTRAVDERGNLFSATPSGGWFRSSPIIPGLGFCLGTRGQMFWLHDPNHPAALAPRKRPRTTLSPTLAVHRSGRRLAFGTPGGDQQDQWTLQYFLNIAHFGMDLQEAADAPYFQSRHFPSSFYPRTAEPGALTIDERVPLAVREELSARGHKLATVGALASNSVTAVAIDHARRVVEAAAGAGGRRNYALAW